MNTNVTTNTIDTDVLIVGAGPTGLALATTLQRAGVTPIIVDKLATGQNTSRAAVVHAHTLEVLDQLGVSDRLGQRGLKLDKFSIRDRDRVLVQLHFGALPSEYAFLLMIPQDSTEAVLGDAFVESGGMVRRGCTVQALTETADAIEATVVTPEGTKTIRARYVVGADGMHSVVREAAGIGFTGARYEESFVLADVEMTWGHGHEEVMLFFSPGGLVVVAPLPSGACRIVATLADAPEKPGISDMQRLLDARGPTRGRGTISRVLWSTRFRLHHRVADHYRRGRFLVIGDAAHVHSPAGGQGMNTGLVDAYVLARLLADVVSGRKGDDHLDHYEALRRPAAKKVLSLAGRLTYMATMKSAPQRFVRNIVLSVVNAIPAGRRLLEMNLSGLSRRAAAVVP